MRTRRAGAAEFSSIPAPGKYDPPGVVPLSSRAAGVSTVEPAQDPLRRRTGEPALDVRRKGGGVAPGWVLPDNATSVLSLGNLIDGVEGDELGLDLETAAEFAPNPHDIRYGADENCRDGSDGSGASGAADVTTVGDGTGDSTEAGEDESEAAAFADESFRRKIESVLRRPISVILRPRG